MKFKEEKSPPPGSAFRWVYVLGTTHQPLTGEINLKQKVYS